MKKLLLASIIMLGICSFANAQTLVETVQAKKAAAKNNTTAPATTNATSLTPQKAVAAAPAATIVNADGTVVEAKAAVTTTERTDAERATKMEQIKQAEKAAAKKTKDN